MDLADRRKTEIVERIGEHRRVFKASNEGVLATQHAEVEASCNRVFLEDNEDRTEAHCTLLFSELKNMVNEEKEHLDKQRSAVSRHLEDLIKKDQQLSDEKVKEMILKIETLYAVDEDGTGKVAAAGAGGVPVVTAA